MSDNMTSVMLSMNELNDLEYAIGVHKHELNYFNKRTEWKIKSAMYRLDPILLVREKLDNAREHIYRMFLGYVIKRRVYKHTVIKQLDAYLEGIKPNKLSFYNYNGIEIEYKSAVDIINCVNNIGHITFDYWFLYADKNDCVLYTIEPPTKGFHGCICERASIKSCCWVDISNKYHPSSKKVMMKWASSKSFLTEHLQKIDRLNKFLNNK